MVANSNEVRKVVILGDESVGKTAIIQKFVYEAKIKGSNPTLGV